MSRWLRAIRRKLLHRTDHRRAGDTARDRGDWIEAAERYLKHLETYPNDAPIWIQLGHALKESERLDDAATAYSRATRLLPNDADLLMSIGHVHKLRGALQEAFRSYDQSALQGATSARMEIAALLGAGHQPEQILSSLTDPRLLACLQQSAEGLEPSLVSGIRLGSDGWLEGLDDDPWIEWRLDGGASKAKLASLQLQIQTPDGREISGSRLYIDYGQGYEENRVLKFEVYAKTTPILLAYPGLIRRLRWDPSDSRLHFYLETARLLPIWDLSSAEALVATLGLEEMETGAVNQVVEQLFSVDDERDARLLVEQVQSELPPQADAGFAYRFWRERYVEPNDSDYRRMQNIAERFNSQPTFSIVIPVYNPPVDLLYQCVRSLLLQNYPPFEICLADDCSPDPAIKKMLEELDRAHPSVRVAYRETNGHISAASNSALELATGDFVVLVDHDDLLPAYALWTVAWTLDRNPQAAILFSDEDKIDLRGRRHSPYFKGKFDPYLMYGHNMVSHLGVYRRDLVSEVGGFRCGVEGSQDYDLFLRCLERVGEDKVVHIPHVLYHWRTTPGSTSISEDQKSYAVVAAQRAINDHLWRTGKSVHSVNGFARGVSAIETTQIHDQSISIIIPTRDGHDLLRAAIRSIHLQRPRFCEILIIDNDSSDPETRGYLDELQSSGMARVISAPGPFNFSDINNKGSAQANGEILCFLNNDVEVESSAWLDRARMLLALPDIGIVGARLLYPDRHVQHFGLGLGMAEHRVAAALNHNRSESDPGYFGKARLLQQFGAVTAACMFVRRDDFQRIGGFDPALAVAYNDVDLCLRFRRAGLRVVCDPQIQLVHKESRSRGSDAAGSARERLNREATLMRERWGAVLDSDPFLSPNHALDRIDFALAYPPRVPLPWRRDS